GRSEIEVNSTHHQAVKDPGRARVCAVAPDQIVEAIELPDQFAIGVQWHPELLAGNEHLALYRALVERARRLARRPSWCWRGLTRAVARDFSPARRSVAPWARSPRAWRPRSRCRPRAVR